MSTINNWKFTNHDNNGCSWETNSQTGEILGKSKEIFKSKIDAIHNANLLGFDGGFSNTLKWTIFEEADGWHWKALKKNTDNLVALAHKPFINVKDAFENAFLYGCPKEYVTPTGVNYNIAKSAGIVAAGQNNKTISNNQNADENSAGIFEPDQLVDNQNVEPEIKNNKTNTGQKVQVVEVTEAKPNMTNTDTISKVAGVTAGVAGMANAAKNNVVSSNHFKSSPTIQSDKVENIIEEKTGNNFWNWFLPLLLLLGLLLWWLPSVLGKKAEAPKVDLNNANSMTIKSNTTDITATLKNANLSKLNIALGLSGLNDTINKSEPSYLLAPTDEAFDKLPDGTLDNLAKPENKSQLIDLLKGHLIPGKFDLETVKKQSVITAASGKTWPVRLENEKLMVNGVEVDANIDATAGDISILKIPAFLLPLTTSISSTQSTTSISTIAPVSTASETPKVQANRVIELLQKQGNYNTLIKALEVADLKSAFDNNNEFTIFAPTDEAFGRLPAGVLDSLLQPENKPKLQNVLKYHVTSGKKVFADFQANQTVQTLNGQSVNLTLDKEHFGQVKGVNNAAQAPIPDINEGNVIVHVLPTEILLP
jgi:transforming growth factor-beta-induced protein